ncbi:hypothetical protein [Flavicella sp.]|uniref:hypothetical protein n=1 Tax=Flavicella sp. TaxID=2957742 RepID=UPI00301846E1
MRIGKNNKILLEPHEIEFIHDNFFEMTNQDLADALGLRITKLRMFAYEMGLKKIEMEYWKPSQVLYLKKYYKSIGDVELAEIFSEKWSKNKGWSKKHIEKKRRYLHFKRTSSELKKIHSRNVLMGRFKICNIKMWEKRGITPIGEKRIWFNAIGLPYVVVKKKDGFVHYNRDLWKKANGPIAKGMNVCVKPQASRLEAKIDDLELLSNGELSRRNSQNRVHPELAAAMKLNREITKHLIKATSCQQTH